MKNTLTPEEMLAQQFGSYYPKLTDVAAHFLNMDESSAKDNASRGKIPFKFFRTSDSRKSEWLVSVKELAKYLEDRSHQ